MSSSPPPQEPPSQPYWDGTQWRYPSRGPSPQPYWDGTQWRYPSSGDPAPPADGAPGLYGPPPTGASHRRSLWRGPFPYLGIVAAAVIVVLVAGIVFHLRSGGSAPAQPTAGNVQQAVRETTHIPASVYDRVGTTSLDPNQLPISVPKNPSTLTGAGGLPEVLYMGGEYCPYCGAARWVMLAALSRFGSFSGVQASFSSSSDVYPNTPTFTFVHTRFSSRYVDFVPVEMYSRNPPSSGGPDLQKPTAQEDQLASRYDPSGGIPFILIGARYVGTTPFSPQDLAGRTQRQIAAALSDPSKRTTQDIVANANLLTAAICSTTDGAPSNVCQSAGVQKAAKLL